MNKILLKSFKLLERKRTLIDFGRSNAEYGSILLVYKKISSNTTLLKGLSLDLFLLHIGISYGTIVIQVALVLSFMCFLVKVWITCLTNSFFLTNMILKKPNRVINSLLGLLKLILIMSFNSLSTLLQSWNEVLIIGFPTCLHCNFGPKIEHNSLSGRAYVFNVETKSNAVKLFPSAKATWQAICLTILYS